MEDVRKRREALGASRAVVAELAELSQSAIWRIEAGRPHEGEVEKIEKALVLIENGEASPTHRGGVQPGGVPSQQVILGKLATVTELVAKARKQRTVAAIRRTLDQALEEVGDLTHAA